MNRLCKVSVVMPCFNHGEFLPEAVDSVNSIVRDDTEMVVVDDGSTDERTHKEMDKVSEAGVKVIRQENRGLAAARNAAIRASKGEDIFPLDADDRLRSGWMEGAIAIFTIWFLSQLFPPAFSPELRIYISNQHLFVLSAMTPRAQRDQIIGFIRPQLAAMYEMMDVKIF